MFSTTRFLLASCEAKIIIWRPNRDVEVMSQDFDWQSPRRIRSEKRPEILLVLETDGPLIMGQVILQPVRMVSSHVSIFYVKKTLSFLPSFGSQVHVHEFYPKAQGRAIDPKSAVAEEKRKPKQSFQRSVLVGIQLSFNPPASLFRASLICCDYCTVFATYLSHRDITSLLCSSLVGV